MDAIQKAVDAYREWVPPDERAMADAAVRLRVSEVAEGIDDPNLDEQQTLIRAAGMVVLALETEVAAAQARVEAGRAEVSRLEGGSFWDQFSRAPAFGRILAGREEYLRTVTVQHQSAVNYLTTLSAPKETRVHDEKVEQSFLATCGCRFSMRGLGRILRWL